MIRPFLNTRLWLLTGLFAFLAIGLSAQSRSARETALSFLQKNPLIFELTQSDVADVKVIREYRTKHNGVTHVWVQQQHKGIPLFNGLFGLHVKTDGNVVHLGHRFVNDLAHRVNTELPSIAAAKALEMAMANLGFTGFPVPALRSKTNEQNFVFEKGSISRKDIPVSAAYVLTNNGSIRLAWEMVIDQANTSDLWTITVDAQTGMISTKLNHTTYCQLGHGHRDGGVAQCGTNQQDNVALNKMVDTEQSAMSELLIDEKYNVFALPVESPIHGNRSIVTNPADATASPYGWLDTNGATGQEYTYTRGNNVWAFEDSASDDLPNPSESSDGGVGLNFDFPFDPNAEPVPNLQAAVTNLFYMNNMIHDVFYRYGFDEEAGNFQFNNYGNGGQGNDEVYAQAIDGSGVGNASFTTPPDGDNGRMQMFIWNKTSSSNEIVSVNGPAAIIGSYEGLAPTDWGAPISAIPVTSDVVFVNDGSSNATLGCIAPVNDVAGKIVMVDRGVCEFGKKALNVQNAGGIACIICNFEDATIPMAPGQVGFTVAIPVVMMGKSDCDLLRQYAGAGLNISIGFPYVPGPNQRDGDLDNGIIAHEYHHGISNRLTGNGFDCLSNDEQMGEGWSDFAALVLTVEPGDQGTDKRGIGNFVKYQEISGQGLRRYPYSTDMSIAPLTFGDVPFGQPRHDVGEVWNNMLWDLYWAMVEKYGYDADLNNTNSGNFRAVQLVVDGMKFQPCSPGFVDGRDAILAADLINYNGADTCLIFSVFTRRGLGYLASQGSSEYIEDGVESFDPIPTCIKELKITKKTTTPTIEPGDNAIFEIKVTNHKDDPASSVVVTDELPNGLTLVSASDGGIVVNGKVRWDLGTMLTGQTKTLTYTAKSDAGIGSNRYFHDLLDADLEWFSGILNPATSEMFILQTDVVHPGSGTGAFVGRDLPEESDYTLSTSLSVTVTGAKPALRFWHQYVTEAYFDAGFPEVQDLDDPSGNWNPLTNETVIRDGYDGEVSPGTFGISPLHGFSGNSNGWKQSYFDLSAYSGKTINFRFRFGSDVIDAPADGAWYIDEVEIMDLFTYQGEACITDDSGSSACATAPVCGVVVKPVTVGTEEPNAVLLPMTVQPNPADNLLHISMGQALEGQVVITLVAADGRTVMSHNNRGMVMGQLVTLNVQNLPTGVYTVRLQSNAGNSVQKVVIR